MNVDAKVIGMATEVNILCNVQVTIHESAEFNSGTYLETKLYSPGVASFLLHTASITADLSFNQLIARP